MGGLGQAVRVYVRVRPPIGSECNEAPAVTIADDSTLVITRGRSTHTASFDGVLGPDATQADVFERVRETASAVLDGYNATIFAYGQTGSGKTHTMQGIGRTKSGAASLLPARAGADAHGETGVLTRIVFELFALAEARAASTRVTISVSYLQIYNEHLQDLLHAPTHAAAAAADVSASPPPPAPSLALKEDTSSGEIVVANVLEVPCASALELLELIGKAAAARATRATRFNEHSSRSHAICQVLVETRPLGAGAEAGGGFAAKRAKLNLVDLAGSERPHKAQSGGSGGGGGAVGPGLADAAESRVGSDAFREATSINTSLLALANCISALAERRSHVPFRDSLLTRLLQDALGGNALTTVLAAISPAAHSADETVGTLKFADRARSVMQHAVSNSLVVADSLVAQRRRFQAHIARLVAQIDSLKRAAHGTAAALPAGEVDGALAARLRSLAGENSELKAELARERDHREQLEALVQRSLALSAAAADGGADADGAAAAARAREQAGLLEELAALSAARSQTGASTVASATPTRPATDPHAASRRYHESAAPSPPSPPPPPPLGHRLSPTPGRPSPLDGAAARPHSARRAPSGRSTPGRWLERHHRQGGGYGYDGTPLREAEGRSSRGGYDGKPVLPFQQRAPDPRAAPRAPVGGEGAAARAPGAYAQYAALGPPQPAAAAAAASRRPPRPSSRGGGVGGARGAGTVNRAALSSQLDELQAFQTQLARLKREGAEMDELLFKLRAGASGAAEAASGGSGHFGGAYAGLTPLGARAPSPASVAARASPEVIRVRPFGAPPPAAAGGQHLPTPAEQPGRASSPFHPHNASQPSPAKFNASTPQHARARSPRRLLASPAAAAGPPTPSSSQLILEQSIEHMLAGRPQRVKPRAPVVAPAVRRQPSYGNRPNLAYGPGGPVGAGSLIYILGASANSTRVKQIQQAGLLRRQAVQAGLVKAGGGSTYTGPSFNW